MTGDFRQTLLDPPVNADGTCAHCGKPRKISKDARKYAGDQIERDPWCSSRCCRAFHGCSLEKENVPAEDAA